MSEFAYDSSPYSIPDYKSTAHQSAWRYLAAAGSWWTGSERLAIAGASRDAHHCGHCADRKQALSPLAITGDHEGVQAQQAGLPPRVVDAVHRITTDPARLTQSWVDDLIDDNFSYGHYVEMVSVIVTLISIDSFHRALDLEPEPLPEPLSGAPDRYWPAGAALDVAWVPMLYPENLSADEADIFSGAPQTGHVIRAMSLVPEAVRQLNALSAAHYLPTPEVMNMSSTGALSLSRPQIELVAARTSKLNDCFY